MQNGERIRCAIHPCDRWLVYKREFYTYDDLGNLSGIDARLDNREFESDANRIDIGSQRRVSRRGYDTRNYQLWEERYKDGQLDGVTYNDYLNDGRMLRQRA